MARYCTGNRKLAGNLDEIKHLLPWRRKSGKGGKDPGMQNPEMKGRRAGGENTWRFPAKFDPTEREKKVLISKVSRIVVQILWTTFTYEFAGELFVQMEGGPIGARITMAASRLVMQEWSERYSKILRTSMHYAATWMIYANFQNL